MYMKNDHNTNISRNMHFNSSENHVSVSWMEICQPKNKTITGQLHIKSPSFPEAWTGHIKCQCDIEGHAITIATRTLVLSGASVLEVSHNDQGNKSSWPKDNYMTTWDKINRKLVIARNATKIKVSIDTTTTKAPANTITLFMFDFQGMVSKILILFHASHTSR